MLYYRHYTLCYRQYSVCYRHYMLCCRLCTLCCRHFTVCCRHYTLCYRHLVGHRCFKSVKLLVSILRSFLFFCVRPRKSIRCVLSQFRLLYLCLSTHYIHFQYGLLFFNHSLCSPISIPVQAIVCCQEHHVKAVDPWSAIGC